MRPTLHDYVIEQVGGNGGLKDARELLGNCYNYAMLTNRAPRLGDLLETEREQIEEAANFGITRLHIMEDAEQYYKETYG